MSVTAWLSCAGPGGRPHADQGSHQPECRSPGDGAALYTMGNTPGLDGRAGPRCWSRSRHYHRAGRQRLGECRHYGLSGARSARCIVRCEGSRCVGHGHRFSRMGLLDHHLPACRDPGGTGGGDCTQQALTSRVTNGLRNWNTAFDRAFWSDLSDNVVDSQRVIIRAPDKSEISVPTGAVAQYCPSWSPMAAIWRSRRQCRVGPLSS